MMIRDLPQFRHHLQKIAGGFDQEHIARLHTKSERAQASAVKIIATRAAAACGRLEIALDVDQDLSAALGARSNIDVTKGDREHGES